VTAPPRDNGQLLFRDVCFGDGLGGRMLRSVPRQLTRFSRKRELSSLYSPMFPQRPLPEVEETVEPKKKDSSPDFLDAHGGKVILAVISAIGFSIYRWIKGGNNKMKVEDEIAHQSPLHPFESNQFRVANVLTDDDFLNIVKSSRQRYGDGLISYEEFIQFVKETCPKRLSMAYYLDRTVLSYLESNSQKPSSKIPLSLFLIALSNALPSPPQDRSELLFDVAQTITAAEIDFFLPSDSASSSGSLSDTTATARSDDQSQNEEPVVYCSLAQTQNLVTLLDLAWQVRRDDL
jgi:hypothetical protein